MTDQNKPSVPTLGADAIDTTATQQGSPEPASSAKAPKIKKSKNSKMKKKRGFFSRLIRKLLLWIFLLGLILAAVFWGVSEFSPDTATSWKERAYAELPELPESLRGYAPDIRGLLGLPERAPTSQIDATENQKPEIIESLSQSINSQATTDQASNTETLEANGTTATTASLSNPKESNADESKTNETVDSIVAEAATQDDAEPSPAPIPEAVASQLAELSETTNNLRDAFNSFSSVTGQKQQLQLNEAAYLVKLANQHLSLTKNVPGALGLLESADKVLSETSGIDVIPARKVLSGSMSLLKEAGSIDTESLFFKLSDLEQQVISFEFAAVPQEQTTQEDVELATEAQEDATVLGAVGDLAKGVLNKAVRIREVAEINPLLDAQGQQAAKQNTMLLIAQAKISLLQRQGKAFQASIAQAKTYIENMSSLKNEGMVAALSIINDIEGIDINPELPDLSPALSAVNQLVIKAESSNTFQAVQKDQPQPVIDVVAETVSVSTEAAEAVEIAVEGEGRTL